MSSLNSWWLVKFLLKISLKVIYLRTEPSCEIRKLKKARWCNFVPPNTANIQFLFLVRFHFVSILDNKQEWSQTVSKHSRSFVSIQDTSNTKGSLCEGFIPSLLLELGCSESSTTLRIKSPNPEVFLIPIFSHLDWILRFTSKCLYLAHTRGNMDQKNSVSYKTWNSATSRVLEFVSLDSKGGLAGWTSTSPQIQKFLRSLYLNLSELKYPADIYRLKINNRNTRTSSKICSKLTIKGPELWTYFTTRSSVFIVNS